MVASLASLADPSTIVERYEVTTTTPDETLGLILQWYAGIDPQAASSIRADDRSGCESGQLLSPSASRASDHWTSSHRPRPLASSHRRPSPVGRTPISWAPSNAPSMVCRVPSTLTSTLQPWPSFASAVIPSMMHRSLKHIDVD